MLGLVIIVILLWIRPEYLFLLFYVVANYVLVFLLLDIWRLTWADAPAYTLNMAISVAVTILIGLPVVALFKWLKSRKSGDEKRAERLVAEARAEAARQPE